MNDSTTGVLEILWRGERAGVRKNTGHPDGYAFIDWERRTYFLCVVTPGMSRRAVRTRALDWLRHRCSTRPNPDSERQPARSTRQRPGVHDHAARDHS